MNRKAGSLLAGVLLFGAIAAGCKNESPKHEKPGSAKGLVTKIDLVGKRVQMQTTLEKSGKETSVEGTFGPETEVWINGIRKHVEDVNVGDEVRVEYTRGGGSEYVVQKVEVTRSSAPAQWKRTNLPQPAEAPVAPVGSSTTRPKLTIGSEPTLAGDRVVTTATATDHEQVMPASHGTTPPASASTQQAATPPAISQEALRAQKTAEIYTLIRERMNESVAERAKLLKAGKTPADIEVAKHETVIRNARKLLMQIGESLDPVVPPLTDDPVPIPASSAPAAK
ncbi:MAG: hypothetical protein U1A27_08430 [Phycisphaerae bacterium]